MKKLTKLFGHSLRDWGRLRHASVRTGVYHPDRKETAGGGHTWFITGQGPETRGWRICSSYNLITRLWWISFPLNYSDQM